MPYLNPKEVPDADMTDYRYICVCVPDHDEYLIALRGSLNFLATWVAWERDGLGTASRSANLWKVANEITKLNWDNECGGNDMAFDCEAMKDCLIEVARAISVNVTVNNSCGGGGDSTAYCVDDDGTITVNPPPIGDNPVFPVIPYPPGVTEPPDLEPGVGTPPAGWVDWEEYDADACAAANAVVEYAYQYFYQMGKFLTEDFFSMGAALVVILNVLTSPLGLAVLFERALSLKIVELVGRYWWVELIGAPFVDVAEWIDANRQEFVCELYQSRGQSDDWSNIAIDKIFTFASSLFYTTDGAGYFKEMLTYMIPGGMGTRLIYMNSSFVNPNLVACDCPEEGDFDVTFDFTNNVAGWSVGGRSGWSASAKLWQNPRSSLGNSIATLGIGVLSVPAGFNATVIGQPKVYIKSIHVNYTRDMSTAKTFVTRVRIPGGTKIDSGVWSVGNNLTDIWDLGLQELDAWTTTTDPLISLEGFHNGGDLGTDECYTYSVRIRGRAV